MLTYLIHQKRARHSTTTNSATVVTQIGISARVWGTAPELFPNVFPRHPNPPFACILYTMFKNASIGKNLIYEGQENCAWGIYQKLYVEEDVKVFQDSIAKILDRIRSMLVGRIIDE